MKKEIFKKLSFWVTICCLILGFIQTICLYYNVEIYINIIVDAVALILSILVCFGVLKKSKTDNKEQSFNDLREEITDEIKDKIANGNPLLNTQNEEISDKNKHNNIDKLQK